LKSGHVSLKDCHSTGIPVTAGTNTICFISRNKLPPGLTARALLLPTDLKRSRLSKSASLLVATASTIPEKLPPKAATLATVKLLLNSVISTPEAESMTLDIQDFYLNIPIKQAKYMRVALRDIPQAIIVH
jgi:hypothetical protein